MKYKKGQELFYHECGEILKVKVVKDQSTLTLVSITLEVIEVLQESPLVKSSLVGDIFTVDGLRDNPNIGWRLEVEND